ncbi:unnamed protein product [Candida parapsilosis]
MSPKQIMKSATTSVPNLSRATSGTINKPRTKSRNGCITCKKKRLNGDQVLKGHLQLASYSVTGKSIEQITRENDLISKGLNPTVLEGRRRFSATVPTNSPTQETPLTIRSYSDTYPFKDVQRLRAITQTEQVSAKSPINAIDTSTQSILSPSFENILNPPTLVKERKDFNFDISLTPSLSAILNFALNSGDIDVPSVETIMSPLTLSRTHELSSGSSPVCEINKPLTKTAEHDQILHLYSEYTSGIMSIKNGMHENPWRNLLVPLASRYGCLFNSIAAMTLFHLAGSHGIVASTKELRSKAQTYMKRCILELASGLSKMENGAEVDFPADIALATCLNLAVCESWDVSTSSGIAHLKGAKTMINKILSLLREHQESVRSNVLTQDRSEVSHESYLQLKSKLVLIDQFEYEKMIHDCKTKSTTLVIPNPVQILFNTWIYFSVIAQMTTETNYDEKGVDLVATITSMISNNKVKDGQDSPSASDLSESSDKGYTFFEEFDAFNYDSEIVDPLLGCGQNLFCIIGKVAALVSKIRKTKASEKWKKRNSLNSITQASELRHLLLEWKSTINVNMIKNEEENGSKTWDLPSCIATAEAYRYATINFEIIKYKCSAYLPLLVASCEAEPGEEREWCKARWKLLVDKMWIGNVDRAFEVVEEVWRRKDKLPISDNKGDSSSIETTLSGNYHNPLNGLMSVVNNENATLNSSELNGIESKVHWSNIMKEWGWEVLLG